MIANNRALAEREQRLEQVLVECLEELETGRSESGAARGPLPGVCLGGGRPRRRPGEAGSVRGPAASRGGVCHAFAALHGEAGCPKPNRGRESMPPDEQPVRRPPRSVVPLAITSSWKKSPAAAWASSTEPGRRASTGWWP